MGSRAKNCENKLISWERAAELVEEGWKRADLHVHTTCSFDILPVNNLRPESLYKTALDMGMDYITFTDHDTIEAHEILGWDREKLVSGAEISVCDLKSFVRYLKRHKIPYIYNHPFWFEFGPEPDLQAIPRLVKLFPVFKRKFSKED